MFDCKIYNASIGSTVGCNYEVDEFKRGFRYNITGFGVKGNIDLWVFKEVSSEGKVFSVCKKHTDFLIANGNIKNL